MGVPSCVSHLSRWMAQACLRASHEGLAVVEWVACESQERHRCRCGTPQMRGAACTKFGHRWPLTRQPPAVRFAAVARSKSSDASARVGPGVSPNSYAETIVRLAPARCGGWRMGEGVEQTPGVLAGGERPPRLHKIWASVAAHPPAPPWRASPLPRG